MNNKQKNTDFFDDLFDKLQNDDSFINNSISDFGKQIKSNIDDSLKKNGYDNLSDAIVTNIESGFAKLNQDKTKSKPKSTFVKQKEYQTRFAFLEDEMNSFEYVNKRRGYYREGHQLAIRQILSKASKKPNSLLDLESEVKKQIDYLKHKYGAAKDKKNMGYLEGMIYSYHQLINSKIYMMSKIHLELNKNGKPLK